MNNKIKKSKGFTLTELIVVIVIIGILAAVLIPTLTGYIKKANQSADEQEVAMLNKMTMLWDYEDNKPASVKELKAMLEEEGYTGDYSLRVKGNYLWYDVKENRFAILAEEKLETLDSDELTNLATNPETYKLTTNMKTPEGLLNNNGSEVWLVGGNGELVDHIDAIRNIANNDNAATVLQNVLDKLLPNVKTVVSSFINNTEFKGDFGTFKFTVSEGTVSDESSENDERVNVIISSELMIKIEDLDKKISFNNFLNSYVDNTNLTYFEYINSEFLVDKSTNEQIAKLVPNGTYDVLDGSYTIDVEIYKGSALASQVVNAVRAVLEILTSNNTESFTVLPNVDRLNETEFKNEVLTKFPDNDDLFPYVLKSDDSALVDIALLMLNALYYNIDENVPTDGNTLLNYSLDNLFGKNSVKIYGNVLDTDTNTYYEVIYKFNFKNKTTEVNN